MREISWHFTAGYFTWHLNKGTTKHYAVAPCKACCRYRWSSHARSKLMGCGTTGCAFDVRSEQGVRGVKKIYYANSSVTSKPGYPTVERGEWPVVFKSEFDAPQVVRPIEYPFIFTSAVESLHLLDGKCSVAPMVDICNGDRGYLPYIVYEWKGHTTIQSYYIDSQRPIPGPLLLSWFNHAMNDVSPCVANHGLVVSDTPPPHVLIDPIGVLIPVDKFVLIDADGYAPSKLWGTGVPPSQLNTTATLLNRILFGVELFTEILKHAVLLPDARDTIDHIRHHIHTSWVLNNSTMLMESIEHPDITRKKYARLAGQLPPRQDVRKFAGSMFVTRAQSHPREYPLSYNPDVVFRYKWDH